MDPKRMIDGGVTQIESQLLRAADRDGISLESRRSILGALGVAIPPQVGDGGGASGLDGAGSGATTGTLTQGATGGVAGSVAGSVAGKSFLGLLGAGIVGAAATWGYVQLEDAPPRLDVPEEPSEGLPEEATAGSAAPDTPRVETARTEVAPYEAEPGAPDAENSNAPAPSLSNTSVARRPPAALASDSLSQEFALIESARAALGQNDGALTLRRLNEYEHEFPKGKLRAEATMLRIEGLVATGHKKQAARIAGAVLKASPNGPYSRRIRSLLGEVDENDETSR